jgi:phosphoribosyl-ATP pyrophosphohydrolase/phosphoribosyl-AMP cyclohydrolase
MNGRGWIVSRLERIIRTENRPDENSYISGLFKKGINKIAQKVGEEAVERLNRAKDQNDAFFP